MKRQVAYNQSTMNLDPTRLDATGKVVLDQIYDQKTPLHFYNALAVYEYTIPQLAKPVFDQLVGYLNANGNSTNPIKIIDLGCSYGVNGALLQAGKSLEDLFERYRDNRLHGYSSTEIILKDKSWFADIGNRIEMIGVDISEPALNYAAKTGLIDGKLQGNFEERGLRPGEAAMIKGTDLIISTGCIGYVGHKTITALLDALAGGKPLMAHFVLRTISFDEISEGLAEKGYRIKKSGKSFRQRRFASEAERESTLKRLHEMEIETKGLEAEGWYYADLFIALPKGHNWSDLPEGIRRYFD